MHCCYGEMKLAKIEGLFLCFLHGFYECSSKAFCFAISSTKGWVRDSGKKLLMFELHSQSNCIFVREQEEETIEAAAASQANGWSGMMLRRGRSAGENCGRRTLTALNSLLKPLMRSYQLHRISVSGWMETEAASCVWVFRIRIRFYWPSKFAQTRNLTW